MIRMRHAWCKMQYNIPQQPHQRLHGKGGHRLLQQQITGGNRRLPPTATLQQQQQQTTGGYRRECHAKRTHGGSRPTSQHIFLTTHNKYNFPRVTKCGRPFGPFEKSGHPFGPLLMQGASPSEAFDILLLRDHAVDRRHGPPSQQAPLLLLLGDHGVHRSDAFLLRVGAKQIRNQMLCL